MRTGPAWPSPWSALVWHLTGAATILLVPSHVLLGQPFWALPPEQTAQVLAMVAAYLALALLVSFVVGSRARLIASVIGGTACFGAAYGTLTLNSDLSVARLQILMSAVLGIVLVWTERAVRRRQLLAAGTLATLVVALTLGSSLMPGRRPAARRVKEWTTPTLTHAVAVRVQQGLFGRPQSDGGAIEPLDDGYLIVTGEGRFFRLWRESASDTLVAEPLATVSPLNREEYLASQSDPANASRLRATDLLADTASDPPRAIAAHQYWNIEEACFTMRVSAMPLDSLLEGSGIWETLFESSPCLPPAMIIDTETGGRLVFDSERRLLLTVGDHGYDGVGHRPDYPQSMDADYGKLLAIGPGGTKEVVSLGHRNPQGLTVDRRGRIWLTEHGPRGGDEINLVTEGGNYGWPVVTYGTSYDAAYWRGGPGLRDHGRYIEPAFAFVPSVGINQVIEVGPGSFPGWDGDLLIASLRGQSLFHVRTKDGRAMFVERIRFDGHRIRDIAQGADGHIVLFTDKTDVLSLSTVPRSTGQFLYGTMCAECHNPRFGANAGAPDLGGVVDRPIASTDWQGYSPALQRLEGSWNEELLDAFLRDPDSVAPGNRMQFPGIADAAERQLIIDYLATLE